MIWNGGPNNFCATGSCSGGVWSASGRTIASICSIMLS